SSRGRSRCRARPPWAAPGSCRRPAPRPSSPGPAPRRLASRPRPPARARPRRESRIPSGLHIPSVEVAHRFRFVAFDVTLDISLIEQVEDADLAERFELEDDLDARQVDPLASGEEADDTHPPDVRLRVETEVVSTLRAEES